MSGKEVRMRRNRLRDVVAVCGPLTVGRLAYYLSETEQTVRNDLRELEKAGWLRRGPLELEVLTWEAIR